MFLTEFVCTTRICAGENALSYLSSLQAERVLVITDRFFSQNGTAARIGGMIPGAKVEVFDRVTPDPTAETAAEAAAVCTTLQPQILLALGGGSPMDCAKAVRLAAEKPMLFIAIPTTSGSGSEVTSFSILTHGGVKHPLVDGGIRPNIAILDDSLLQSLPPSLVAHTGMDLLSHCMEALAATGRSPFTDSLAMSAAETVFSCLKASYHGDVTVRSRLHQAATMAGIAFDNAGLGLCHGLAHALGGRYHLPHGVLCAMVLPHVMKLNAPKAGAAYRRLAAYCQMGAATEQTALRSLTGAISRLRSSLSMPETLTAAGLDRETIRASHRQVLQAALEDGCLKTNPVPVTEQAVEQILRAVEG